MARSLIFVCVVLATLAHFHTVSSSGMDVIQSSITDTLDITKGITLIIKDATSSAAGALDDHLGTTELINILTGLVPDIGSLVQSLGLTATDTLKNALKSISDAVATIKSAVLDSIPLLTGIVNLLGALLQEVVDLLNSLLGLLTNILGSLTGNLDKSVNGLLVSDSKRTIII